jgi:hypothetical protein
MASTCMGKRCYPAWLDNLADGVTGSVGLGTAPSNERRPPMKSWSLPAKYMSSKSGSLRGNSFLEDYTSGVGGGVPLYVIVLVTFNADGKAQRLVVNHRPRSSLLSRLMLEKFAGTALAKHREGTP